MSQDKITEKKIGSEVVQTPVVSVIIPAYNVAGYITETLDSILRQTYRSYEIVLVNDGSPDTEKLENALAPYFKKIIYVKRKNGGTAAARNTAIANSGGELLAFLDGDDVWLPEYLEAQIAALNEKKCDLIYTDAHLFGDVNGANKTFMQKSPSQGAVTTESLINGNCNVITSGTVARRTAITQAGLFDEELPRIGMEDFDLWFRLAKNGNRIAYQRKVLLKYRVRADSLSGSNVQRAEREVVALDIVNRKYELTAAEKKTLFDKRSEAAAMLEFEKGKLNVAQGNFRAARENFRAANLHYRKFKLTALDWILQINPQLARRIFHTKYSSENSFAAPNESVKIND